MKKYMMISALLISFNSFADCNVYIPEKVFLHDSGYSLSFDFDNAILPKKYVEVWTAEEADYQVQIEGIEKETPYFHHAVGVIRLVDADGKVLVKSEDSGRCFTQYCGISDYAKSFSKAYKAFSKSLPACH